MANVMRMSEDRRIIIDLDGNESDELRDILWEQVPAFLSLFIQKNSEYKENAQTLGPKGQFADIWRKIGKLKTALWEDQEHLLTSEGVDEILMDLIGHCLLTLNMRSQDSRVESGFSIESNFTDEALGFLKKLVKEESPLRVTLEEIALALDLE